MNSLSKTQKNIVIAVIILFIGIVGYYVYGRDSDTQEVINDEEIIAKDEENSNESQEKIKIHITGAIQKEGIVTLYENSRVADAIEAAGGLKDDADMTKINLALILEDGMKLNIPSINDKNETEDRNEELTNDEGIVQSITESSTKSRVSKININKAGQIELETLPGIGSSIALKIINYRNENGKFSSIEDLKKVSGIGDNKFDNIKELICVK